jgi:hypothetical protein
MTGHPAPRTLWRDEAGGRVYLVPDDAPLPEGGLLLRAGATRRISVDEVAVAEFEVSRDEARAFLDARLDGWVAGVQGRVEDALAGLGIEIPPR